MALVVKGLNFGSVLLTQKNIKHVEQLFWKNWDEQSVV